MNNDMKYAVVVYTTFDDVPVYLFDTYDKAKEYLKDMWQHQYNEGLVNDADFSEYLSFHNDECARIMWNDGDYIDYRLTCISEPIRINGKSYK